MSANYPPRVTDQQMDDFMAWWGCPENHLIQMGSDVAERIVLNCVLCDAELRITSEQLEMVESSIRFRHAPGCDAKSDHRSVPEVDKARPDRELPDGLVDTRVIEALNNCVEDDDFDELTRLPLPEAVSQIPPSADCLGSLPAPRAAKTG